MRTLIIGAGGIAYAHAEALVKLGIEIAGVYDIREENARRLAKYCGSRAVTGIDEALERVDTVHLLTPPSRPKLDPQKSGQEIKISEQSVKFHHPNPDNLQARRPIAGRTTESA